MSTHRDPPCFGREGPGGQRRKREDLEGETSPWETRANGCWQRQTDRNGLVSGARPRSWPLPRRVSEPGTWQRAPREGTTNSGARTGREATASAGAARTVRVLDHLDDVGVRFGGSEPHRDPGHGPSGSGTTSVERSPPRPGMPRRRFRPSSRAATGTASTCFGRAMTARSR
jgi:hypothetical protein